MGRSHERRAIWHPDGDAQRGLIDFQPVVLTGVGLEPGLHEWYQCRGGAVDESDCDGYNADFVSVGPDGTTSETVYVEAASTCPMAWRWTAAPTRLAACSGSASSSTRVSGRRCRCTSIHGPVRPPVSSTVDPSTGLAEDDQMVTVHGEHLSFREEAFAYLCTAGDGAVGTRARHRPHGRTVPDHWRRAPRSSSRHPVHVRAPARARGIRRLSFRRDPVLRGAGMELRPATRPAGTRGGELAQEPPAPPAAHAPTANTRAHPTRLHRLTELEPHASPCGCSATDRVRSEWSLLFRDIDGMELEACAPADA